MSATRIAPRYAKALIDLAVDNNKLDHVISDVETFNASIKGSRELYLLLKSPIVNTTKKEAIFKALFESKFDKMTFLWTDLLLKKGREAILPEILEEVISQYKQMKNISLITITSASPLDEATIESIKKKTIAAGITSNNIEVTTKIDTNLIGGYIVQAGDNLFDASVSSQLRRLKDKFDDNEYINKIINW